MKKFVAWLESATLIEKSKIPIRKFTKGLAEIKTSSSEDCTYLNSKFESTSKKPGE